MAGKSSSWENALLLLLFNNTNAANIGDSTGLRGSSSAGSLFVSLHTADPGPSGDQTTNEITYSSYARVAVARSGSGWTVTANSVSPTLRNHVPRRHWWFRYSNEFRPWHRDDLDRRATVFRHHHAEHRHWQRHHSAVDHRFCNHRELAVSGRDHPTAREESRG